MYGWRILTMAVACLIAVFFMNLIFDIRVRELKTSLKSLNNNQTSFRTLALISRYQLIRDRMVHSDEANQFRSEGKTMLALSQSSAQDETDRVTAVDRMGIGLINSLNWLTGSEPLRNYQSSIDQRTLELAYLYELRRDYAKAIETYDLAIKMIPGKNQEALQYAYLHRGFCLSLLDKKNEALADYSIVIASNSTGEFRYTAEILSSLLRDLLERSGKIDSLADSEGKAEAYYKLAAYPKAFAVYDKLQKQGALSARALYYSGRVHEELGQADKAAEKFRSLISTRTDNDWALRANRRIYALGAFYGGDKKYREESQKNAATVVQDKELIKVADKFESVIKQNEASAKTRQAEIEETVELVNEEKKSLANKPAQVPIAIPVAADKKSSVAVAPPAAVPQKPRTQVAPPAIGALPATPPAAAPAPPAPTPPQTPEAKLQSALTRGELTRAEKKEILMSFKEIELIILTDENEIWGIPFKEDKDRISFFTVMGKVNIARNRIKSREKIESAEAFR